MQVLKINVSHHSFLFCAGSDLLLPFGLSEGDQLVLPALDGTTAPQNKLAFSGVTCPFFGVDEIILHVGR